MSKNALVSFLEEQVEVAKQEGILFSLHMKATMMKVSDPIIFGHAVRVFFADLFKKHGKNEKDTGSAEGQIALFTLRINHLTEHLKNNRKDYNTERSLVKLVGKRRSLLDYLTKVDVLRYRAIVKELNLRK
jgi:small subunit ribosomal protein S15